MPIVNVSSEFEAKVRDALHMAQQHQDEAYRFMAVEVPVYAQMMPDQQQAVAGGCPSCTYLGLWADRWRGFPDQPHGTIWLFEDGIRKQGGHLGEKVYATLLHEFEHALGRDHVLDAIKANKALGIRPYAVRGRCCGGR